MLAEVNNRCGIIESLTLQGLMKTAHVQLKSYWFHKYRPCSEPLNINILVCESNTNSQTCSSLHFQCMDDTCVLLIYRCDGTADCFDGSDEHACSYNATPSDLMTHFSHNLDCLFHNVSNENQNTILQIQDVCDGIYTDELSAEQEICRANQRYHIYHSLVPGGREEETQQSQSLTDLIYLFIKEMSFLTKKNNSYISHNSLVFNKTVNVRQ